MTPLEERLIGRIAAQGPITVAEYMAECLLNPEHGYYATRDPFGAAGDFTTAPEISQMFGELIGLALAQAWQDQGAPSPFLMAELGPGRGTLMADALRAADKAPGFAKAARIHLVEASATLRKVQEQTLAGRDVTWVDTVQDLPDGPLFLVANEFFDALPIRQFERATAGWAERQVGLQGGKLAMGLAQVAARADLAHRLADTRPGDVVELCAAAQPIIADIAQRIAINGGAALVIDYGGAESLGDTFQALRAHEPTDPLSAPGNADLTAHVDFGALARTAQSAAVAIQVSPLITQGVFLERLGITPRAQALARRMAGPLLQQHVAAHRRLTHPEEMGTLFKVMALAPLKAPLPPGCH